MTNKNNERYSTELKATAIKKMMPPENRDSPIKSNFGHSRSDSYSWRKKLEFKGILHPNEKMSKMVK